MDFVACTIKFIRKINAFCDMTAFLITKWPFFKQCFEVFSFFSQRDWALLLEDSIKELL